MIANVAIAAATHVVWQTMLGESHREQAAVPPDRRQATRGNLEKV
jgi:hypothetical protein